jgi:hypothetical protein
MNSENLYLVYDFQTLDEVIASQRPEDDNWDYIEELFYFLLDWGFLDLKVGICKSFTIYNQDGVIVFESHKKLALEGEVA